MIQARPDGVYVGIGRQRRHQDSSLLLILVLAVLLWRLLMVMMVVVLVMVFMCWSAEVRPILCRYKVSYESRKGDPASFPRLTRCRPLCSSSSSSDRPGDEGAGDEGGELSSSPIL